MKLYDDRKQQQSIAVKFYINKSVISQMISRYRTCGNTKIFHSGGRSRLTSNRDDKAIIQLIEKDPFISAKNIKSQIDLNIAVRII